MPTYPRIKTFKSGFYDNKKVNGVDDRVYSAKQMRKPYDVIYTDGIKPDADGTAGTHFQVTSAGGMNIAIAPGFAKVGGAWIENEASYIIGLEDSEAVDRYDCVILQNDDSYDVRDSNIYIKPLYEVPTSVNLKLANGENVSEVCLAYVKVPAFSTDISTITDTRDDAELCGIMSGVGAMVVRTYNSVSESTVKDQTDIPINIPQYNKSRGDTLIVTVEGRVFTEGVHYTILSNTHIRLTVGLPVIYTKVGFQVLKNVNAAGAETVVQEVAQLRGEMTSANKILEHHYYCNGLTDNVVISNLVTNFQSGGTDYASMRLVIHGTFGATSWRGGEGTADKPYYWIGAAQGSASKRRVTLDFTDCSDIRINCTIGTVNIVFFGMDCRVIGANVIATGGTTIYMFSTSDVTTVYAENCRFWITCDSGGFIARSGTFKDCRASVTNSGLHSYCFAPISGSLLRVFGGEYYAYTGSADHVSAIVGLTSGENAVAILYAVNAPTSARSGYNQTNSIYQTTGMISCTDLISALPLKVETGLANIRGTLAFSKPGLM